MNRALLLDRDGTVVERRHYPSRIADLVLIDGVADMLRQFQTAGWKVVIVTNQSGVTHGYFTESTMHAMNAALTGWLAECHVTVDAVYACIHTAADHCTCRKPSPGMLLQAAHDLAIDLPCSWMVGDFPSDIEAGERAGCQTAYIDYGTHPLDAQPTIIASTTPEALQKIWAQVLR